MTRRTDVRRNSRPVGPELFSSPEEKAALEARNGLIQFDEVRRLIGDAIVGQSFHLRPSTILKLQRLAIQDLYVCAGTLRQEAVEIKGTTHTPPPWDQVQNLLEELCDYVNENWAKESAIHLAAYLMWRINWIHPFRGGNGRTARAVSYLVMCVRSDMDFGGTTTVADQIVDNREPYYAALDSADAAWQGERIDVSAMEELLDRLLARQLLSAHEAARCCSDDQISDSETYIDTKYETDDQINNLQTVLEKRKSRFTNSTKVVALIGAAAVIVAAIIAAIVSMQPPKCTPNDTKECRRKCQSQDYAMQVCKPDGEWTRCKCLPYDNSSSISKPRAE